MADQGEPLPGTARNHRRRPTGSRFPPPEGGTGPGPGSGAAAGGAPRGSAVYATTAWKKARKAAVEKAGSSCRVCGVVRKRVEVDHIYGKANDPDHQWLQVLCPSCHLIKTTIARRTKNRYTREQVQLIYSLALAQILLPYGKESARPLVK